MADPAIDAAALPSPGKRPRRQMEMAEVMVMSETLGKQIAELTPPQDLVIGLANGGTLPAIVAAKTVGLNFRILRVRRKSSRIKQRLPFLRKMFSLLPDLARSAPVVKFRRKFEQRFDQIETEPYSNLGTLIEGQRIVIVDDCVDSGSTVAHVRADLLAQGARSVRVAVISWATKHNSEKLHGVTPDIYLNRTIDIYPWALGNPEFRDFVDWVEEHGQGIWA